MLIILDPVLARQPTSLQLHSIHEPERDRWSHTKELLLHVCSAVVHLLGADGSSCQHGESHLQSKTELRLSFCQKKIDICVMLSSPLIVLSLFGKKEWKVHMLFDCWMEKKRFCCSCYAAGQLVSGKCCFCKKVVK